MFRLSRKTSKADNRQNKTSHRGSQTAAGPECQSLEPRLLMSNGVLLITNEALVGSFQQVANWYTRKGYPAQIVTTEDIYENYSGVDAQAKIRNCITEFHNTGGADTVWQTENQIRTMGMTLNGGNRITALEVPRAA